MRLCERVLLVHVRVRVRQSGRGGVEAVGFFLEDWPGAVGGAVVNDDDFVWDAAEVQLEVQMLDSGCDAPFLVAGRNDDGEQAQGLAVGDW